MAFLTAPLDCGQLHLKNRLVMPPLATGKSEDGRVGESLINYYDEKSAGGYISFIIVEHAFVSPEGRADPRQVSVADDGTVAGLAKIAEVIHKNGSKTAMQLNHAGSNANPASGETAVAPTAMFNPRKITSGPFARTQVMPRELTRAEITALVERFRDAARRAKAAGYDAVEIHSAHGYLLNQFMSPLSNHRTDNYGGSLLNRIRLHIEVIEAVRAEVGAEFPVLLRLGAVDHMPGGTVPEDAVAAAIEFERAGVNILDISGGFCGYNVPGHTEAGFFAPVSRAIKEKVSIPVIVTGGVKEAAEAEEILARGDADLVGVGRAILADSGWARRNMESIIE